MRKRVLSNPLALVDFKESIASMHTCRRERREASVIRVYRAPSSPVDLDAYFNRATRAMMVQ